MSWVIFKEAGQQRAQMFTRASRGNVSPIFSELSSRRCNHRLLIPLRNPRSHELLNHLEKLKVGTLQQKEILSNLESTFPKAVNLRTERLGQNPCESHQLLREQLQSGFICPTRV